ncbi:hypothetical protein P9A48_gp05 [Xanthomonas phage Mallos]|uniref:Uncharacterized protein n=1 Tax=Xanthomonas phage Mallos TaxID=2939131 RepID=A0A9E7E1W8_9CAUD|nr:hypothetical protein P9A48_gp05 [Xanthomonas phage Mallos]URA07113.1 hypothetical protein Mallos_BL6005 [Xanthomonas phage Mallos]
MASKRWSPGGLTPGIIYPCLETLTGETALDSGA